MIKPTMEFEHRQLNALSTTFTVQTDASLLCRSIKNLATQTPYTAVAFAGIKFYSTTLFDEHFYFPTALLSHKPDLSIAFHEMIHNKS